jgi:hypothetical protein
MRHVPHGPDGPDGDPGGAAIWGAAGSDPNDWLKGNRHDKLKGGEFDILGPVGKGLSFSSQRLTFVCLGLSKGRLLLDCASKMHDSRCMMHDA